jgi:hypothetical protein
LTKSVTKFGSRRGGAEAFGATNIKRARELARQKQMPPIGLKAIWDALALAEVADAALRTGDVSRERLLPYERLRHPINDKSISFSRAARRVFRIGRFLPLAIVPSLVVRTINTLNWPKRKILGSFATTFVHPQKQASAAYRLS